MKLHYSQTCSVTNIAIIIVLLPYEITLFSNVPESETEAIPVLLPYEITLFSNKDTSSSWY